MKKLLLTLVLVAMVLSAGCGMVDSYEQRARRIDQVNDLQWRMFVDDWDYLWLQEKNTRLNEWHAQIEHVN